MFKKHQIKDKEFIRYFSLFGRLAMNMVVPILGFFFLFFWLDGLLHTGRVLLIVGILIGIFSGVYLNYQQLKKYYDKR